MKKIMKKRFLILSIITFCISVLIIFLLSNNDNAKIEIAKDVANEIETNYTIPVDENENANNEIIQDIVNSNIDNEQTDTTESIVQDTTQTTNDKSMEKKQTVTEQVKVAEKKAEEKQSKPKETTSTKLEIKQQETIVSNTKEETSKTEPSTPVETTPKQENTQTNTNNKTETTTKDETISNPTKPVDTIKRISTEELQAEKAKYLKDIQTINPGLKYKEVKRGQVFWPYRTTEIEIAVGSVSFGTVYYYVDVFVEGNQEKFKYYIDWTGE